MYELSVTIGVADDAEFHECPQAGMSVVIWGFRGASCARYSVMRRRDRRHPGCEIDDGAALTPQAPPPPSPPPLSPQPTPTPRPCLVPRAAVARLIAALKVARYRCLIAAGDDAAVAAAKEADSMPSARRRH